MNLTHTLIMILLGFRKTRNRLQNRTRIKRIYAAIPIYIRIFAVSPADCNPQRYEHIRRCDLTIAV